MVRLPRERAAAARWQAACKAIDRAWAWLHRGLAQHEEALVVGGRQQEQVPQLLQRPRWRHGGVQFLWAPVSLNRSLP